MKEQLDDETRTAMVDYRLERARQTLGEADLLRTGDYFNATVNRLYYACYYAASALLLNRHIEANTHNGVKTQLSMHFVRTGLLDKRHSSDYGDFAYSSDYGDFAYCDAALVDVLRPRAEAFINAVEQLVRSERTA